MNSRYIENFGFIIPLSTPSVVLSGRQARRRADPMIAVAQLQKGNRLD
jgi:hypothetical protein